MVVLESASTLRLKRITNVHKSWNKVITEEFIRHPDFIKLRKAHIRNQDNLEYCPEIMIDIFEPFRINLNEVKVVIITDFIFGNHLDNGHPLSVEKEIFVQPKQVETMTYCLMTDLEEVVDNNNFDFSLEDWRDQGVITLSTSPTCIAGKPSIFSKSWLDPMKILIKNLSKQTKDVVFVFLGDLKDEFTGLIDNHNKQINLYSLLLPYYNGDVCTNLYDREVFNSINECLKEVDKEEIKWIK